MNVAPDDQFEDPDRDLAQLRLLHLADSALPIGSLAHSFGLESLVAADLLNTGNLGDFLKDFLQEAGFVEAVFCRHAFVLASSVWHAAPWLRLNDELSARKAARESRIGSASLGKNFLSAVNALGDFPAMRAALSDSKQAGGLIHHAPAFGLAAGALGFDETSTVAAFLHQTVTCMVSSCQRLLPLGQSAATRLLWDVKPALLYTVKRCERCQVDDACSFTPLLDWGAMEHPALSTRLFVT
jgi:urease accessory protein